ncbi:MAG TPA: phosphatidate cytidylyltransferase [Segeticoccus sp.]|nr:phosphatidate cytidylyltransferase [Segeticoccus sp.]
MTAPRPGHQASSRRERRRAEQATGGGAPSRAGRNLPAAIGVGLALGGAVLASLLVRKEAFVALETLVVALGVWELAGALRQGHIRVPQPPALLGTVVMVPAAYVVGGQSLLVVFVLTCLAVLVWRAVDGVGEQAVRDITGGVLVVAYAPLLAAFPMLMLAEDDGPQRVLVFIIVTVCSDVGGYAAGVLAGRHPMAPSISPKKSWEGFAGSTAACVVGGVLTVVLLLDGTWWAGAAVGVAAVLAATLGDLSESMIKRDLGIKDMGSILPGHGGVMDRLDSLLVVAPVAWALLALLVPVS